MNHRGKSVLFLIIGLVVGAMMMHFCSNYTIQKKDYSHSANSLPKSDHADAAIQTDENFEILPESDISELTNKKTIIDYIKNNHGLPDYYITKSEARRNGWNPSAGNLCDVLPGKAIGGDRFSNREKSLPAGGQYFEADVNYHCGNRGADRVVFTKSGDVWLTEDHYRTFQKQ